jgi:hypothetical protein
VSGAIHYEPSLGSYQEGGDCFSGSCSSHAHQTLDLPRLVFGQSQGRGRNTIDNAALRKLNELLTLGADPKALGLPVQLSRVIWRGRSVADIAGEQLPIDRITPDRVESVSQQIVSAMPQWLKYDPTDKMVGDVKKLLVHYRLLSA